MPSLTALSGEDVCYPMPFRDAIDEDGIVLGVVGAQRQNLLICHIDRYQSTRSRAIWDIERQIVKGRDSRRARSGAWRLAEFICAICEICGFTSTGAMKSIEVRFAAGDVMLEGNLTLPDEANGVVLFAHGSGSSRSSPRNTFVAGVLNGAGLGTLLFDLLTKEEEAIDLRAGRLRFNISLLSQRLLAATDCLLAQSDMRGRPAGLLWGEHGRSCCTGGSGGATPSDPGRSSAAAAGPTWPPECWRKLPHQRSSSSEKPIVRCSRGTANPSQNFAERNASKSSPGRPICSKNRASSKRLRGWRQDGLLSI